MTAKRPLLDPLAQHSDAEAGPDYARAELQIGRTINGRLELTSLIGTGVYGAVYAAYDLHRHERLAVKILPKLVPNGSKRYKLGVDDLEMPADPKAKPPLTAAYVSFKAIKALHVHNPAERAYREAALHLTVHGHPNVLSILEILESRHFVYLVLEYFPKGDLFHAITDLQWYVGNEANATRILLQLVDAVSYCHRNGVYHCDLKPENVLVSADGLSVRLADFGLATTHAISRDYGCGSSFYMAPERLVPGPAPGFSTAATDIWALAIILLNTTCGRNPWRRATVEDSSFASFLREGSAFLCKILPITPEFSQLLASMLHTSPERRLPLADLRRYLECGARLTVDSASRAHSTHSAHTVRVASPVYNSLVATPSQPARPVAHTAHHRSTRSLEDCAMRTHVVPAPIPAPVVVYSGLPLTPVASPAPVNQPPRTYATPRYRMASSPYGPVESPIYRLQQPSHLYTPSPPAYQQPVARTLYAGHRVSPAWAPAYAKPYSVPYPDSSLLPAFPVQKGPRTPPASDRPPAGFLLTPKAS